MEEGGGGRMGKGEMGELKVTLGGCAVVAEE